MCNELNIFKTEDHQNEDGWVTWKPSLNCLEPLSTTEK